MALMRVKYSMYVPRTIQYIIRYETVKVVIGIDNEAIHDILEILHWKHFNRTISYRRKFPCFLYRPKQIERLSFYEKYIARVV